MTMQMPLFGDYQASESRATDGASDVVVDRERATRQATKPMSYCVLGSGSGGNCAVVRLGDEAVLVDAGFGPARTTRWLVNAGLQLENVKAFCLTHLDQDHFRPTWVRTLIGFGIDVWIHRWHLYHLQKVDRFEELEAAGRVRIFENEPFEPITDLSVSFVHLPHDNKGTIGYILDHGPLRIGHATDLGHVPDELVRRFAGVDLLAIESNYDIDMQKHSKRPTFLKKRIMGGKGHLSNDQAFDTIRRIDRRSPDGQPQHIVLLHRSADCNSPRHIREVFDRSPHIASRVTLTQQRRRTKWFHLSPLSQCAKDQIRLAF